MVSCSTSPGNIFEQRVDPSVGKSMIYRVDIGTAVVERGCMTLDIGHSTTATSDAKLFILDTSIPAISSDRSTTRFSNLPSDSAPMIALIVSSRASGQSSLMLARWDYNIRKIECIPSPLASSSSLSPDVSPAPGLVIEDQATVTWID